MIRRPDIVEEARSWLGTRFQHQASLKGVGADCFGLVVGVAYSLGIFDQRQHLLAPAYRGYSRSPDPKQVLGWCDEYLRKIDLAAAEAGDVLVMRFEVEPRHLAILSGRAQVLHAYAQARRVVENRLDALWRSRVVAAYSYPGVIA